jgi:hypothetical protein
MTRDQPIVRILDSRRTLKRQTFCVFGNFSRRATSCRAPIIVAPRDTCARVILDWVRVFLPVTEKFVPAQLGFQNKIERETQSNCSYILY